MITSLNYCLDLCLLFGGGGVNFVHPAPHLRTIYIADISYVGGRIYSFAYGGHDSCQHHTAVCHFHGTGGQFSAPLSSTGRNHAPGHHILPYLPTERGTEIPSQAKTHASARCEHVFSQPSASDLITQDG